MNYETWLHEILIANEAAFKTETETETKSLVILECLRNSVLSVVWEWERDIYIGDLYHRVTTPYFQAVTVPHAHEDPPRSPFAACDTCCSYYIRRGKTILSRKEQVIGEVCFLYVNKYANAILFSETQFCFCRILW